MDLDSRQYRRRNPHYHCAVLRNEKSLFHKLYVGLLGGISKLLENRPRGEVATKADGSGPIGALKTSTWQIIPNLIRNAFIKSILGGFEKELSPSEK